MSRVAPLEPPYEPESGGPAIGHDAARGAAHCPVRTFARNMPMTAAMDGWGHYELSLFTPGGWSPRREFCGCGSWRAGVRCRVVAGHPDWAAGPVFSGMVGAGCP